MDKAKDQGYKKGILLHIDTYRTETIFVKLREDVAREGAGARSLEKRKKAECMPKEQIVRVKARELLKKQIENNHQFKEVVDIIRETDYIQEKKALSLDEMVPISISLFENDIGYYDQQEHYGGFFGEDPNLSSEESVALFKQSFKKEIFYGDKIAAIEEIYVEKCEKCKAQIK